jgi:hypothetical protein
MFKRHPLMRHVREEPLEQCPDLTCRRSGQCHARNPEWECRKYVRTDNEFRHYIADKIERLYEEWAREHPKEAAAAALLPEPDWGRDALPEIRKAIEAVKAERAREAGRRALEGDKPARKRRR